MADPTIAIGLVGAVIILGVLLTRIAEEEKIPGVLPLILLGILLGPIAGFFNPSATPEIVKAIVLFALIVVLFDAGYDIRISRLKKELLPAFQLTILAFLASVGIVVAISHFILNLSLQNALLLGAILGSTDITVIAPIMRVIKNAKLKDILNIEAALNSVFAIVLATVAIDFFKLPDVGQTAIQFLQPFLYQIFVGIGLGIVFGYALLFIFKRLKIEHKPELLSIGSILLVYAFAELLQASGIFAVLVTGIILGNAQPPLKKIITTFEESISLLMIVFVFVILGALLNLSVLLSAGLTGLLIAGLVALSRWPAARAHSKEWGSEEKFIFVVGPRGMTTVVLALFFASQFPDSQLIIGITFIVVLATIIFAAASRFYMKDVDKKETKKSKGSAKKISASIFKSSRSNNAKAKYKLRLRTRKKHKGTRGRL